VKKKEEGSIYHDGKLRASHGYTPKLWPLVYYFPIVCGVAVNVHLSNSSFVDNAKHVDALKITANGELK